MSYSIKRFDGSNITLADCYEIARVRIDGLRTDVIQLHLIPESHSIHPDHIPHIADWEIMEEKTEIFKRRMKIFARLMYVEIVTNPCVIDYVLVDDTTGKFVGAALWYLPVYSPVRTFQLTFGRRVFNFFVIAWNKLLGWFTPKTPGMAKLIEEYALARSKSGLDLTDENSLEVLRTYSKEKLDGMVYPKDLSYYLDILGVRSDVHKLGLGRKILEGSIAEISKFATPPPGVPGPAKMVWQSVPSARGFYRRLGYTQGPTLVSERGFDHTVFFTNVD